MKPDLTVTRTGDTVTITDEHGVRHITETQLKAEQGFTWSTPGTELRKRPSIAPEVCIILFSTVTIVFTVLTLIGKLKQ